MKASRAGFVWAMVLCFGLPSLTPAQTPADGFTGLWVNANPFTSGITRVELSCDDSHCRVHMWGSCVPQECDWGEVVADRSATVAGRMSVTWNKSFVIVTQELAIEPDGRLRVSGHSHYTDNSGRRDYDRTEYFLNASQLSSEIEGLLGGQLDFLRDLLGAPSEQPQTPGYMEVYTYLQAGPSRYLNVRVGQLQEDVRPASAGEGAAYRFVELENLSFSADLRLYAADPTLCRPVESGTTCDYSNQNTFFVENLAPVEEIPADCRVCNGPVFVLRDQSPPDVMTLDIDRSVLVADPVAGGYRLSSPQEVSAYAVSSSSELGKVCRLIIPPNLSGWDGFAGEGSEIHNDIRVVLCVIADLAGALMSARADTRELVQERNARISSMIPPNSYREVRRIR